MSRRGIHSGWATRGSKYRDWGCRGNLTWRLTYMANIGRAMRCVFSITWWRGIILCFSNKSRHCSEGINEEAVVRQWQVCLSSWGPNWFPSYQVEGMNWFPSCSRFVLISGNSIVKEIIRLLSMRTATPFAEVEECLRILSVYGIVWCFQSKSLLARSPSFSPSPPPPSLSLSLSESPQYLTLFVPFIPVPLPLHLSHSSYKLCLLGSSHSILQTITNDAINRARLGN